MWSAVAGRWRRRMGQGERAALLARIRAGAEHPEVAALARLEPIRVTDRGTTLRAGPAGGGWSVVVKLVAEADAEARAGRMYRAHAHAYARCSGDPRCGVPEPLGRLAGLPGYAMRHVPGASAHVLVRRRVVARRRLLGELLGRAGAWLDAYHAACGREAAAIAPRYLARTLAERHRAQVAAGRGPPERPAFERALAVLQAAAQRLGRPEFPRAAMHGDFNLHNLVVDGARMWGIDFLGVDPAAPRPVSLDVHCCLFYLHFRDGWRGGGEGTPGGFDRQALEVFARAYPALPWGAALTAWLMLHHQLRQWLELEGLGRAGQAGRLAAMCDAGAATLAARLTAEGR